MILRYTDLLSRGLSVNQIQRLGWEESGRPLVVDDIVGKRTLAAHYLDPSCVRTPIAAMALSQLLEGAQEAVGQNNKGRFPRRYMPTRWYGGSWCAGFASWCARAALGERVIPWTVGAQRLGERVAAKGTSIKDAHQLQPDDFVVWDRDGADPGDDPSDDRNGHVGIVVAVDATHFYTIEGNRGRTGIVRVFRYNKDSPHMVNGPFIQGTRLPGDAS